MSEFDDAVEKFRAFIRGHGWPTELVWRQSDDVLLFPGPKVVVRKRGRARAESWARRFYQEGTKAGVGIELHAVCLAKGQTCATVFWTLDEQTAALMMLPRIGLKMSCSENHLEAQMVGSIRWWLAKQVLQGVHARLAKGADA